MATLVGSLLHYSWHLDHLGYSEASSPTDGPDPVATTGAILYLLSSWRGWLTRVIPGLDQGRTRRFYWLLSPSLSLSSFQPPLSYLFFPSVLVLDTGVWLEGLSLIWGLTPDHLCWAENSNSSSGLVSGLYFQVGLSSHPPFLKA